jgi:putative DNA primase/helicase
MKAIDAAWGDYFRTADWSTFAQNRDGDIGRPRPDLVRLVGARIVSASEGDEGCKMSEGVIKRVTGRAPLVVRDLMSKPFAFFPQFKLWLDTNHLPRFAGQDQAMWNRIRMLPFRRVITPEEQRQFRREHGNLDDLLAAEASGILNLALRGWKAYQEMECILPPRPITEATTEYRKTEDVVGAFLEERCIVSAESMAEKGELFAQYCEWAKENLEYTPSMRRFGVWMQERGFQDVRTKSARCWRGVAVQETRAARMARENRFFTA